MKNGQTKFRVKDYIEYKMLDSSEFSKNQIKVETGKATEKYSKWFNVRNLDDNAITNIDSKNVENWKATSNKEVLLNSHMDFSNFNLITAELNLKNHSVYKTVVNESQEFIALRWVNSES